MKNLLAFKNPEEESFTNCPCREDIRDILFNYHINLLKHCAMPTAMIEDLELTEGMEKLPDQAEISSMTQKLMSMVWKSKAEEQVATEKPRHVKIGM